VDHGEREDHRHASHPSDMEVTLEMIEAGCAAMASFDNRYEDDKDAVQRIYHAMLIASGL
jgi:DNA gyrase inhibitor GyrI